MKKLFITTTLLLLLSLKPLFAGVAKGVDVREVQTILASFCFNTGPVDGVWGKKTEKAAEEFFTKYFKIYGGYFGNVQLKMLQSSNRTGVVKGEKLKRCSPIISKKIVSKNLNSLQKILETKLNNRRTINVFKAWDSPGTFGDVYQKKYGLYWTVKPKGPRNTILLDQVNWAFNYPRYKYDNYAGIKKFISEASWGHDKEYGETYAIKLNHPDYAAYMADIAFSTVSENSSSGIMLDWWHDEHPTNIPKHQIRHAREKFLIEYRKLDNGKTIVLGNVNDRRDLKFARLTNGVFLEHFKEPFRQYRSSELFEMQRTLQFFDENLLWPKIVAFNAWKKSEKGISTKSNRVSQTNKKFAKLFTAMTVVIPENGYILFGDNNQDEPDSDHNHHYYDFYSFDIGKPTGGYEKLANGVGIKQHQKGFIAYNVNSRPHTLKLNNNINLVIEGTSGLFCKKKSSGYDCLPPD